MKRLGKAKGVRRLRASLSYANVMATLGVMLALGGTAYAAATITGADVVDESLTGADILNKSVQGGDIAGASIGNNKLIENSLTGAKVLDNALTGLDIDESSLGKVADADKLDNKDSSAFVQGGGRVLSFEKTLQVTDAEPLPTADIANGALGFFRLMVRCREFFFSSEFGARFEIENSSAARPAETLQIWRDDSLNQPVAYKEIAVDGDEVPDAAYTETAPNRVIFDLSTSTGKHATVIAFSQYDDGPDICNFRAKVLTNQ